MPCVGRKNQFWKVGRAVLACTLMAAFMLPSAAYAGSTYLGLRVTDSSNSQSSGENGQPGSTALGIRVSNSLNTAPLKIKVTFDKCDGSDITMQEVFYNSLVNKPSNDPSREGYTFEGWFTDPSDGQAFDFSTPITNDLTLYAQWKTNVYTVSFETNGGTAVGDQHVSFGATITEPTEFSRDGYGFVAWYEHADFSGEPWDFSTPLPARDVTLYAKWTLRIECSVPTSAVLTIDGNGDVTGSEQPFVSTTVAPLKVSAVNVVAEVDTSSVFPDTASRDKVRILLSVPPRSDLKWELPLSLNSSVQTDFLIPKKGKVSINFGLLLPEGTRVNYSNVTHEVVKLDYVVEASS